MSNTNTCMGPLSVIKLDELCSVSVFLSLSSHPRDFPLLCDTTTLFVFRERPARTGPSRFAVLFILIRDVGKRIWHFTTGLQMQFVFSYQTCSSIKTAMHARHFVLLLLKHLQKSQQLE